jgi:uncharacterized membrane protein
MKIPALTVLTVVLSILAVPLAQAGGHATGGDFRGGASTATSGQSQGQNGGQVDNDGGKVTGSDF